MKGFVNLPVRKYYNGHYQTVNILFAVDDIARVIECVDDYTITNIRTKDGELHNINKRFTDVISEIRMAREDGDKE